HRVVAILAVPIIQSSSGTLSEIKSCGRMAFLSRGPLLCARSTRDGSGGDGLTTQLWVRALHGDDNQTNGGLCVRGPEARNVQTPDGRCVPREATQSTEPPSPFDFGRMEMHRYGAFSAKWRSGWSGGCFLNHFYDWLYLA